MTYYAQFTILENSLSSSQVTGWYDTSFAIYNVDFTQPNYIQLTSSEWNNRFNTPYVLNGSLTSVPPLPVGISLETALANLAQFRFSYQNSGVYFTASGVSTPSLYDTSPTGISYMMAAELSVIKGLWPTNGKGWKLTNGQYINFLPIDVTNLSEKALGFIQECFSYEQQLANELQANPNMSITSGWPSNQ